MFKYFIKRLLVSVLVIFLVSLFTFLLIHMIPGDPVQNILGIEASQQARDELREELHLNDPLVVQYGIWIRDVLRGDLGTSTFLAGSDVGEMLSKKLAITVSIGLPAMVISTIFGVLFGVICAVKRGKLIDQILTLLATTFSGVPIFWLAILGVYFFGVALKVLPIQGYTSPSENFGMYVKQAILPIMTQSVGFIAIISRQTRSNMLEVINQDYVRTARADGLSERRITYTHALKNALIPIVTLLGMQVRLIIGGSVIVERVFNIPGTGNLIYNAVINADYVTVQGCVLVLTLITVLSNLAVDLLYGLLDPRIRLAKG